MNYTFKDDSPIFQQLAKALEDDIFLGTYEEGTAIPSTTELSVALHINPATVLKAMNLLLDMDLIEKRRGIGMFVTNGAKERIRERRTSWPQVVYEWLLAEYALAKRTKVQT